MLPCLFARQLVSWCFTWAYCHLLGIFLGGGYTSQNPNRSSDNMATFYFSFFLLKHIHSNKQILRNWMSIPEKPRSSNIKFISKICYFIHHWTTTVKFYYSKSTATLSRINKVENWTAFSAQKRINVLRPHYRFQIFSQSTLKCGWEIIATDIIWLLRRQRFQKLSFPPSTQTHLVSVLKFIYFDERFQISSVVGDRKRRFTVGGRPIRTKKENFVFKFIRRSVCGCSLRNSRIHIRGVNPSLDGNLVFRLKNRLIWIQWETSFPSQLYPSIFPSGTTEKLDGSRL